MCMNRKKAEELYDAGKEITVEWLLRLDTKVDELTAMVAKLSKNSSNSSKPPSSDITKPGGPNREERRRQKKRKKGAQWGHQKWEWALWGEDEVKPVEYSLNACPECAGALRKLEDEAPRILQQAELLAAAVEKLEHRAVAYWCPRCKRDFYELDDRGRHRGYRSLQQLHERIRPLIMRRRKADVESAEARKYRAMAERKLKVARLLVEGDLSDEARSPLMEAIVLLGRSLVVKKRVPLPESPPDAVAGPLVAYWPDTAAILRGFLSNSTRWRRG